jgi:hypothetical protein
VRNLHDELTHAKTDDRSRSVRSGLGPAMRAGALPRSLESRPQRVIDVAPGRLVWRRARSTTRCGFVPGGPCPRIRHSRAACDSRHSRSSVWCRLVSGRICWFSLVRIVRIRLMFGPCQMNYIGVLLMVHVVAGSRRRAGTRVGYRRLGRSSVAAVASASKSALSPPSGRPARAGP